MLAKVSRYMVVPSHVVEKLPRPNNIIKSTYVKIGHVLIARTTFLLQIVLHANKPAIAIALLTSVTLLIPVVR